MSRWHYNCGGFALGTKDWFFPYNEDDYGKRFSDYDSFYEKNFKKFTKFITVIFENVRKIKKIEDAKEGERIIAFRVGKTDFHFVKVNKTNNNFRHKPGCSPVVTMTEKQFFDNDGWSKGKYDSDIVYFAIKGKKAQYKKEYDYLKEFYSSF